MEDNEELIPIKKKKSKPKRIGNSWEREFCKILSKWVSPNSQDLLFWRSASSGAVSTIRKKKNLNSVNMDGDITCLDLQYIDLTKIFYFECKTVKNNDFNFWSSPKSDYIYSSVIDTFKTSYIVNKVPFLAIKVRNSKTPQLIILPSKITKKKDNSVFTESISINTILPHNYCTWHIEKHGYSFVIVKMNQFFEKNNWETLLHNFKYLHNNTNISDTN
jgi:hypothetical protein